MKIKKGDNVLVISGKDRGKTGKVVRAIPAQGRVIVEGVNVRKKHMRPRSAGQKGQIVEMPAPIAVSAAMIICGKCGKATRAGYTVAEKQKSRICKKCGAAL